MSDTSLRIKKRIGYRIFLVSGDDVAPLSKTAFDDFYFGRRAVLQEFAGRTVDIATVVCRLEDARLSEIVRIYCQRFRVNDHGSIDKGGAAAGHLNGKQVDRAFDQDKRQDTRAQGTRPTEPTHQMRLAQSLTMISGKAQKKILDALGR